MRADAGTSDGRIAMLVVGAVALAIGGGALFDGLTATKAVASELPAFTSCQQLQSWVERAAAQEAKTTPVQR